MNDLGILVNEGCSATALLKLFLFDDFLVDGWTMLPMVDVRTPDSFKLFYDEYWWGMAITVYGCTDCKLALVKPAPALP